MKMLARAAVWLSACLLAQCAGLTPALAASPLPNCLNAGGSSIPCQGVAPVDPSGNVLDWRTLLSGGGGGSGGAITASDGAIVGIGTLSNPAAGSTNYRLGQILTGLGSVGIGNRSGFFAETTTPLAASATFTGAPRDAGASPSAWASFTCFVRSDQPSAVGGIQAQGSPDGTTWTIDSQGTLTAGVGVASATDGILDRYHRCVVVNGATAEGALVVKSRFGVN